MTLLQTKLYIPSRRPETVLRSRLIQRLDAGLTRGHALTLISAPAGYGKTTLLIDWLQKMDRVPAWITVDSFDNEPARFFAYFFSAFQTVNQALADQLTEILEAPHHSSPMSLTTAFINEISALSGRSPFSIPEPLILVFDDYHTINEPAIHESLDYLLEHTPPGLHIVLLTRQDPPLALSRLRGRGLLTEIRQDELRFSLDESIQFLLESMGIDTSEEDAARLVERTEGWIAGLQLAALSMRGLEPPACHRFISEFSGRHHFVIDYLTDEILERQPAHVYHFLAHTSILDQMCAPLCSALLTPQVLDHVHSQEVLEILETSNLFLVPLDNERRWFRYHHLFKDLLLARLVEVQSEIVPTLHHRAAEWYEENGFMAQAVHHELLSRDMERAAELIGRALKQFATWTKVEVKTFQSWLQALPEAVVVSRPWLRLFLSRSLYVTGQPALATRSLASLEEWLMANQDINEGERLLDLVQADRASYSVVQGETQPGIDYALKALASLPEKDTNGRMRAYAILGMAYSRRGDVSQAEKAFSSAIEMAVGTEVAFAAVPLICNLAETKIVQGRLEEAFRDSDSALRLGTVDGQYIAAAGFATLEQGKILYERNYLLDAEYKLQQALRLLSKGGITESFGSVQCFLALVKLAQGFPDEALTLALEAVNVANSVGIDRISHYTRAFQARIWLGCGSLGRALQWANGYTQLPQANYIRDFEDLTLAKAMLAAERPVESLAVIEPLSIAAEKAGRGDTLIRCIILKALVSQTKGNNDDALLFIDQALDLAAPHGYRRVFLDQGLPMANLLRRASSRGIARDYIFPLLGDFVEDAVLSRSTTPQPADGGQGIPSLLVEPLSPREQEVLLLLADGLSNKEIAQRLFLSTHTIRSHTYNLYSKLGVHSRTQAAARARELGLLKDG